MNHKVIAFGVIIQGLAPEVPRFGDKLKGVTSDFPDEAGLTQCMYNGFGNLREKIVNSTDVT